MSGDSHNCIQLFTLYHHSIVSLFNRQQNCNEIIFSPLEFLTSHAGDSYAPVAKAEVEEKAVCLYPEISLVGRISLLASETMMETPEQLLHA